MRKLYLLIAMAVLVIVFFSFLFIPLSPSSPSIISSMFGGQENQGNETEPFKIPIIFPWQTPSSSSGSKSTGKTGAGSGGTGGAGGTGSESSNEEPSENAQRNYINMDSNPSGLKIFTSYYVNGKSVSLATNTPFNLGADPDSIACFLLASVTSGALRWTVDGQDCQPSVCEMTSYNRTETLYSDHGCLINMNENHSVNLYFTIS